MESTRILRVEAGGCEDAATTFARDQLMMLRCADEACALARIWRREGKGLLLGRFHRAAPASFAWVGDDAVRVHAGGNGLSRRITGGRVVPAGPGIVAITLAVPVVDWLDGAAAARREPGSAPRALKPEQVLNRALRPLLAMLRGDGVEAFYPGRDLVTARGRTVAHASFTVMRDGTAVIEMHIAESASFAELPGLLDACDPRGIACVERDALRDSTTLADMSVPARSDEQWAQRFAEFATAAFACETHVETGPRAGDEIDITFAHESASRDFLADPGPLEGGLRTAVAVSMLGVVECAAGMRGDRLTSLRITGDLIAPFHTLDDIAAECEGEPLRPASVRKALARATAKPRSFILGLRDLDELILRLV